MAKAKQVEKPEVKDEGPSRLNSDLQEIQDLMKAKK